MTARRCGAVFIGRLVSRRDFARLFAAGGSAALFAHPAWAQTTPQAPAFAAGDERHRRSLLESGARAVRDAAGSGVMNAANLCPASRPGARGAHARDRRASISIRRSRIARGWRGAKEDTRKALAEFLRVTPEEIVITRNTSESNNIVSNGLDLKAGDEVADLRRQPPEQQPGVAGESQALRLHGRRRRAEEPASRAPSYYVDAFTKALTPRTKVLAFTHLTSTVGDLFPAKELCALARDARRAVAARRRADVRPARRQPARHPAGLLFRQRAQVAVRRARVRRAVRQRPRARQASGRRSYSAYPGAVGISRKMEAFGQRDEATMIAFGEALAFQTKIGRAAIEQRSRALAQQLMAGLRKIDGFKVLTSPMPDAIGRRRDVPARARSTRASWSRRSTRRTRSPSRPAAAQDRSGLRVSPHFYNTPEEVDRLLGALDGAIRRRGRLATDEGRDDRQHEDREFAVRTSSLRVFAVPRSARSRPAPRARQRARA